ncbi:hypothetical protein D3C75_995410 [compost metagenome]
MTTVTATLIRVVSVNMLYLNAFNSKSGLLPVSCRQENRISRTKPAAIADTTSALAQPILPALLKPYNNVPKPKVDKIRPQTSSLGKLRSVTFFR